MADLAFLFGRLLAHLGLAVTAVWLVSPIVPFYGPWPELVQISPSRAEFAVSMLRESDRLYAAQIGYAGTAPIELLAWRIILHSPARDSIFLSLTHSPSRVAQLYGLMGLQLGKSDEYATAATNLSLDRSDVPVMVGCIMWDEPMATLLSEIEAGVWTREYLTGRLQR